MRLEINAGGLNDFFRGLDTFAAARSAGKAASNNALTSTLLNIVERTNSLKGGSTPLVSAASQLIRNRMQAEENRRTNMLSVKQKTNEFINTTTQVDKNVATIVKSSTEAFYRANEWARPPVPPTLRELGRMVLNLAVDTVSNAGERIVNWVVENREKILEILLYIAVGVAFIALAILTGGIALKAILIIVTVSTLVGGAHAALTGSCILTGLAKGFMAGGIAAFAASFMAFAAIKAGGGVAGGAKAKGLSSLATGTKGTATLTKKGAATANFLSGGIEGFFDGLISRENIFGKIGQNLWMAGISSTVGIFIPEIGNKFGEAAIDFMKDLRLKLFEDLIFPKSDEGQMKSLVLLFTPLPLLLPVSRAFTYPKMSFGNTHVVFN